MSPKALVTSLLLPPLRELFPLITEGDLLFFGKKADISSPAPQKYGVDISCSAVYNICKDVIIGKSTLLSSVVTVGGFINLNVSDEGLGALIGYASSLGEAALPDTVKVGSDLSYVIAKLLDISYQAEAFSLIPTGEARRALWICLMADRPSSLNVAAELAYAAIREHRAHELFGRREAGAMASALCAACRRLSEG